MDSVEWFCKVLSVRRAIFEHETVPCTDIRAVSCVHDAVYDDVFVHHGVRGSMDVDPMSVCVCSFTLKPLHFAG